MAFFLFPHLMSFPRSKFARLTAELADVRDLGKEAALYYFTCRFNPLHIGFCDSSSSVVKGSWEAILPRYGQIEF